MNRYDLDGLNMITIAPVEFDLQEVLDDIGRDLNEAQIVNNFKFATEDGLTMDVTFELLNDSSTTDLKAGDEFTATCLPNGEILDGKNGLYWNGKDENSHRDYSSIRLSQIVQMVTND